MLLCTALLCGASAASFIAAAQTRTDTLAVDTAVLGMTGWRTGPMTVETAVLGMTGWRTAPMTVETAVLGMTSWRIAPMTVETAVLGMTGWRTEPEPPERTHPFEIATANLTLFHNNQPLPQKLEADCPVTIGHKPFFTTAGELPNTIKYHFEWSSGQRSTDFAKLDKGDRKDPLYEPPSAFHEFPYPLPAKDKAGGGKPGPKGFAAKESGQKGPAAEAASAADAPNVYKGSVRVIASNAKGDAVASGWAPYHIACRPMLEVLSGTLDLRDRDSSACPRVAEAALSLRTNVAGPVPFSLDCTGNRSWSQTATAHETAPGTYIAVAILPFEVGHKEQVNCALKSRLRSPPKVVALRGHAYDCARTGAGSVATGVPSTPGQRPRAVDPPRPVCVGGKLLADGPKGARYACRCPAGQTAQRTGPNSYFCQRHAAGSVTCTGGAVRNGQCLCPSTMERAQTGAHAWRCVKRGGPGPRGSRPR
jgi:hypothetical protein